MVRFIPTGGVNPSNLASYLGLPSVLAVGGSWMVARKLLLAGDFEAITELTRAAVELVAK
jgi:2-dehydro-3-deoxyphosphogluconate aldolase/(4S)-4-hydroxy-2-oxoglutarate aldolase